MLRAAWRGLVGWEGEVERRAGGAARSAARSAARTFDIFVCGWRVLFLPTANFPSRAETLMTCPNAASGVPSRASEGGESSGSCNSGDGGRGMAG